MSKNKKTAFPQLRFLQFMDSPAWDINNLGELIIPVRDRAGTKKYTLMSVTSGVGLIPQIEKFGREIAGNAYSSYYVIKKNDFAYNKSATKQFPEGYISMLTKYEEAALPNSIFTCFRIVDEGCVHKFFDHLFHNNYHGSWLRKYIEVGARAHGSLSVDTKHLWDMPVALPRTEEQQKIADCLSSLNDLIAAEGKKLEALKAHKKGLMQKLFPAERETVPKVRFDGFTGIWIQRNLGDLVTIKSGWSPSYFENGINLFIKVDDLNYSDRVQIDSRMKVANNPSMEKIKKGSTIFPKRGASIMTNKVRILGKDGYIDTNMMALEPSCEIDSGFLYTFICNTGLYKIADTSSIPQINNKHIEPYSFAMPSIPEQIAIGNFFCNLDELITALTEKIEALKLHKKGLMQGLFPSIKEVGE